MLLWGALMIPANAQSTSGYEDIAWGASISEVLWAYPEIVLHEKAIIAFDPHDLRKDFSAIVTCYVESNVSAQIKSRNFYFHQKKLFCVSVDYVENMSVQILRTTLENIYGTFADFPAETSKYPMGITITLGGCFKRINEYHLIEVDVLEAKGILIGKRTTVMIRYKDPVVWEQVIQME
jgi:hypothetical protein